MKSSQEAVDLFCAFNPSILALIDEVVGVPLEEYKITNTTVAAIHEKLDFWHGIVVPLHDVAPENYMATIISAVFDAGKKQGANNVRNTISSALKNE